MAVKNSTIVVAIFFATAVAVSVAYFFQWPNVLLAKSIPRKPPWSTEAKRAEYLESLKEEINKAFPEGTEISIFQKKMAADGYHLVDKGLSEKHPERKITFQKKLYDHSCGETWGGHAEYNEQGKISAIEFDIHRFFCR